MSMYFSFSTDLRFWLEADDLIKISIKKIIFLRLSEFFVIFSKKVGGSERRLCTRPALKC